MSDHRILLCNEPSDANKAHIGKLSGFTFDIIPFIGFEYHSPVNLLDKVPKHPIHWVFTSSKAVRALLPIVDQLLKPKGIFTVGPKTALELHELKIPVLFPEEYNARNLQELIIGADPEEVIHFRGNLSGTDLTDNLNDAGIPAWGMEVYQTQLNPKKIQQKDYDGLVFLSPSAIRSFRRANPELVPVPVFSIGERTAAAARTAGFQQVYKAEEATFESLTQTMTRFFND